MSTTPNKRFYQQTPTGSGEFWYQHNYWTASDASFSVTSLFIEYASFTGIDAASTITTQTFETGF